MRFSFSGGRCSQCCPLFLSALFWLLVALFLTTYFKSRPVGMARSARLATTLASKLKNDDFWLNGDKRHLYAIHPTDLGAEAKPRDRADMNRIVEHFIELYDDDATKQFIEDSVDQADSVLTQMWHSLAKSFLSFFYTQTDINGLLARGSMFVFSKEQFRYLLDKAGISKAPISQEFKLGDALMDLGAGDGAPTQQLSTFFSQTDVTETSWSMRNILTRKGFNVLEVESWTDNRTEFYDMISCLNLLDRCERPATVLSQVRGALKPGGLLLVALVLPFRPFVEFGASRKPVEALPIAGETFESQTVSVVKFFESEHFRLMSWTRVPYLCEGDLAQSVYVLDDGLFLFSKTEPSSEESQQKDST